MESVTVRVPWNGDWRSFKARVAAQEGGGVSMEAIFAAVRPKLPPRLQAPAALGLRENPGEPALPWDTVMDLSEVQGRPTLFLHWGAPEEEGAAASTGRPDMEELMRTTVEEVEEERRVKRQMTELVDKDWNRDFGHCFPNLYEGLDEDIAALQAERQRREEEEEGQAGGCASAGWR